MNWLVKVKTRTQGDSISADIVTVTVSGALLFRNTDGKVCAIYSAEHWTECHPVIE